MRSTAGPAQHLARVIREELFDRLFPHGFAGADVLEEIAPDGWERSPLLACFHPSVERVLEETLRMHRNLEELGRMRRGRDSATSAASPPEPTLDEVRREWKPPRCNGMKKSPSWLACLWDIHSSRNGTCVMAGHVAAVSRS